MDLAKYLDAIKLAKMHVAMHAGDLHARSQLAHSAAATLDLELHGTHVCVACTCDGARCHCA